MVAKNSRVIKLSTVLVRESCKEIIKRLFDFDLACFLRRSSVVVGGILIRGLRKRDSFGKCADLISIGRCRRGNVLCNPSGRTIKSRRRVGENALISDAKN